MGHKPSGTGYKIDDLFGTQIWFDRGDSKSVDLVHLVEFPDQIDEFLSPGRVRYTAIAIEVHPLPKITDIDTSQYDFANTGLPDLPGMLYDLFDRIAAAFTSGLRNSAKRTIVVAAILDFQKGTGPVSKRKSLIVGGNFTNFRGMNHSFGLGTVQLIDVIEHLKFFSGTQDQIHPFHLSNLGGLELGVASRDHHPGIWIFPQHPSDKLSAFPVRKIGDRTRI